VAGDALLNHKEARAYARASLLAMLIYSVERFPELAANGNIL
jgi:hypothetical protein